MQNKQTIKIMEEVNASIKKLDSKLDKVMQRKDVMLTPEEARQYEKFSVGQIQVMARITPIASTDGKKDD